MAVFVMSRSFTVTQALACLALSGLPFLAHPAEHKAGPSCRQLCGEWVAEVDTQASGLEAIEAALSRYEERKPPRGFRWREDGATQLTESPEDGEQPGEGNEGRVMPPEEEYADLLGGRPGSRSWRPSRADLRAGLEPLAKLPSRLTLTWKGGTMTIVQDEASRTVNPGESHSRVDGNGTAEIEANWRNGRFTIREDYGRGWRNTDTYRWEQAKQHLLLERTLERPGLDDIVLARSYVTTPGQH